MLGEYDGLVTLAEEYSSSNNGSSPDDTKTSAKATQNILLRLNTHVKNFKIPFNLSMLAQKLEEQIESNWKKRKASMTFSGQNQRYSLKVSRDSSGLIDFEVFIYDLESKSWPAEPVLCEGTYLVIVDRELRERAALKLNFDIARTSLDELREAFRKTSRFRFLPDQYFKEFYMAKLI